MGNVLNLPRIHIFFMLLGGTDRADQVMAHRSTRAKTQRWPMLVGNKILVFFFYINPPLHQFCGSWMLSRIQRSKSHRIPDPQHRPTQTYFAAFYYSVVLRSVPDPWHFGVDPDQDLRLCVIDIQDASNKIIFNTIFSAYYFWRYIYIIFQR